MKTITPLGARALLLGIFVGMTTNVSAGTIARATAQVVNGFVVGVSVTEGGSGYDAIPSVTFIGGGGSGAGAIANVIGESVASITVTNAGSASPTMSASPVDIILSSTMEFGPTRILWTIFCPMPTDSTT